MNWLDIIAEHFRREAKAPAPKTIIARAEAAPAQTKAKAGRVKVEGRRLSRNENVSRSARSNR